MWKAHYQTTTDVPAEALFRAIADINAWGQWDQGLEIARIDGPVREGARFQLKPNGGPNVAMSIEELHQPTPDGRRRASAACEATHDARIRRIGQANGRAILDRGLRPPGFLLASCGRRKTDQGGAVANGSFDPLRTSPLKQRASWRRQRVFASLATRGL